MKVQIERPRAPMPGRKTARRSARCRAEGVGCERGPAVERAHVSETPHTGRDLDDKSERRAARELISAYHQEQLRLLLEHVRSGFSRLDAAEIDEFDWTT